MRFSRRQLILFGVALIFILFASYVVYAIFGGSHTLYTNKTSPANGSAEMCAKCHAATVANLTAGMHVNATCICHGYNVNVSLDREVNVAHNLTKQIYCTNCHADYNATGEIPIYSSPAMSGLAQSAHYITNNTTKLYSHSQEFFSNESYARP